MSAHPSPLQDQCLPGSPVAITANRLNSAPRNTAATVQAEHRPSNSPRRAGLSRHTGLVTP
jgi:hypothetical protein